MSKVFLIFFAFLFFSRGNVFADISNGRSFAKVVENKVDISTTPALSSFYNLSIINGTVIEEKKNKDKKEGKFAITYVISSKPNTSVNVIYSSSNRAQTEEDDSLVIELKNTEGEVIKVKMKKNDHISFDKNGKGDLNVAPEIDFGDSKLNGTYKATYDVIISY